MAYIRSMLAFTNTFHDYQNAYYLANAWLELQLVKGRNHGFGYEDSVMSGSKTIINNLNCKLKNCYFYSSLKTKSYVTSQTEQISDNTISCTNLGYSTNADKLISSLYLYEDEQNRDDLDEWTLVSSKKLVKIVNTNIEIKVNWLSSYRLALQASDASGATSDYDKIIDNLSAETIDLISYQGSFFTQIPDDHQVRVKIINDLKQTGKVCFQVKPGGEKVPSFHQVINSVWLYNHTLVRLEAIQTNIPGDEQDLAGGSV